MKSMAPNGPRVAEVGTSILWPPLFYDLNPTYAFTHVPIGAEARMRRSRQAAVGRRFIILLIKTI